MRHIRENGNAYTGKLSSTYSYRNKELASQRKDLKDFTFVIPLRIESNDRINVLRITLNYIRKYFSTNIAICEEGDKSVLPNAINLEGMDYKFIPTATPFFHKTRLLNNMMKDAKTPYIISNDSDCIFHPHQYAAAAHHLRNNTADFVYPFNLPTHNVSRKLQQRFSSALTLHTIEKECLSPNTGIAPGGCLFINKHRFQECGYENENFLSWGPEDQERRERVVKLGYRLRSIQGKLFHLDHERTFNSNASNEYFSRNEAEFSKIKSMDPNSLREYISHWPWKNEQ